VYKPEKGIVKLVRVPETDPQFVLRGYVSHLTSVPEPLEIA
jgi:hypothetical protein